MYTPPSRRLKGDASRFYVTRRKCPACQLWKERESFYPKAVYCRWCGNQISAISRRRKKVRAVRARFAAATLQGGAIRCARLAHGLSQESLAVAIGLKKADQVRLWEKGEREPSPVYLLKIQLLLNLSPAELLGLTNTEK